MDQEEIRLLADSLGRDASKSVEIIETHISWVLLCEKQVYKIKKPLKLSFLDFSTLSKRQYYCQRELKLNRRLTNHMYLSVSPITRHHDKILLNDKNGSIIDYCLVMTRIDNKREMRALLESNLITEKQIGQIARQLVLFHKSAEVVKNVLNADVLWQDFEDLRQTIPFISENIGIESVKELESMFDFVQHFLKENKAYIKERDRRGMTRDCHGDLHSGNIFILEEPIIFDCIEFNDHFRQIDILNELAFLCIDLEFYDRNDLSTYFLSTYMNEFQVMNNEADQSLFLFYKLYRSNIKVKVNAIKCMQTDDESVFKERLVLFKRYFDLMMKYSSKLALANL